jgi:hypothetical protein
MTNATSFVAIKNRWRWRPIPHCPGRFLFSAGLTPIPPAEIISRNAYVTEHTVPAAHDVVVVAAFEDGGLISFRKRDGTYLHTLNSPEGFARKLQQLGIHIP